MAVVKSQGTQLFTVIDGKVVKFVCLTKIGLGQDTYAKQEITCLDAKSKRYIRGMLDPGEGSVDINYDDENISHDQLIEIANSGDEMDWYVGTGQSSDAPTYDELTGIDLPKTRGWYSFKAYINPTAPNDFEVDSVESYTFALIRNSGVTRTKREAVTP